MYSQAGAEDAPGLSTFCDNAGEAPDAAKQKKPTSAPTTRIKPSFRILWVTAILAFPEGRGCAKLPADRSPAAWHQLSAWPRTQIHELTECKRKPVVVKRPASRAMDTYPSGLVTFRSTLELLASRVRRGRIAHQHGHMGRCARIRPCRHEMPRPGAAEAGQRRSAAAVAEHLAVSGQDLFELVTSVEGQPTKLLQSTGSRGTNAAYRHRQCFAYIAIAERRIGAQHPEEELRSGREL